MGVLDYKSIDCRCFDEVWTPGDLTKVDQFYSPGFVCHNPPHPDILGPEGIRRQVEHTHEVYTEVHYSLEEQVCENEKTVTRWTMNGKVRETGLSVTITGLMLMRFENGLMIEEWNYWDQVGLKKQLNAGEG